MGGIRLAGLAFIPSCSPPFGDGSGITNSVNVYRACADDPTAGLASMYSNFSDGATVIDAVRNPVLSPDRTKILFEAWATSGGVAGIWVVNNQVGSTPTQLIASSNHHLWPSWHPDSNQFVYVETSGSATQNGTIKKSSVSDPGTVTTLKASTAGFSNTRPQFNFDGSRVAYHSDQNVGGTGDLRVMDDDGTNDAAVDSAVKYRFQGPQFSWAHASNVIAYDDGASGSNLAYVVNDDGTGQVQINANGDAVGAAARVSDRAWPVGDAYVVISADLALGVGFNPVRAELNGSNTTDLAAAHGAFAQDYFRQVLVADNRIWFINSSTQLGSVAINGTDYLNYLTVDGTDMDTFGSGNGWFYN